MFEHRNWLTVHIFCGRGGSGASQVGEATIRAGVVNSRCSLGEPGQALCGGGRGVGFVLAVNAVAHDARRRVRGRTRYHRYPLIRPGASHRQSELASCRVHVTVSKHFAL